MSLMNLRCYFACKGNHDLTFLHVQRAQPRGKFVIHSVYTLAHLCYGGRAHVDEPLDTTPNRVNFVIANVKLFVNLRMRYAVPDFVRRLKRSERLDW
jgi:hypothetical protein